MRVEVYVHVVARCQMWEEMLEVSHEGFLPLLVDLGCYNGVWRMRRMKHCQVNQSESVQFVLHGSELRKRFFSLPLRGIFQIN